MKEMQSEMQLKDNEVYDIVVYEGDCNVEISTTASGKEIKEMLQEKVSVFINCLDNLTKFQGYYNYDIVKFDQYLKLLKI